MANKQKEPKGAKAPKGQRSSLLEKLTTLIVVLFFLSLALSHLAPA
jgi:hypothetical protein